MTKDKKLSTVLWDSPAFQSSLRIGDELIAVGETAYSNDALTDAVKAKAPVRLTYKRGDSVKVVTINYTGGLRYPRFVKVGKGDGPLDLLLQPR